MSDPKQRVEKLAHDWFTKFRTGEITVVNHLVTDAYIAGYLAAQSDAQVLVNVLGAWVSWEAEQIQKDGPYCGKAINSLIASAIVALAKYKGAYDE